VLATPATTKQTPFVVFPCPLDELTRLVRKLLFFPSFFFARIVPHHLHDDTNFLRTAN
jgi:hypothetical protein